MMSEQSSFFSAFGGPKRFFILLILGVAVVAYIQWDRNQTGSAMQEVGNKRGFSISNVGNSWRLKGAIDSIGVSVETVSELSAGKTYLFTNFELTAPFQPQGRIIGANHYQGLFESFASYSWQSTGDEAFDQEVLVEGELAKWIGKLNAEARLAISEATEAGWILQDQVWSLKRSGTFRNATKIETLIQIGITAARAIMLDTDDFQDVLDSDIDAEKQPVTLDNAEEVLEEFFTPRSLEAAILLMKNGSARDDVRQRLVIAFYEKKRVTEVIIGLGKVGGLNEIALLESVQGEHEALAKKSIEEIKARLNE